MKDDSRQCDTENNTKRDWQDVCPARWPLITHHVARTKMRSLGIDTSWCLLHDFFSSRIIRIEYHHEPEPKHLTYPKNTIAHLV